MSIIDKIDPSPLAGTRPEVSSSKAEAQNKPIDGSAKSSFDPAAGDVVDIRTQGKPGGQTEAMPQTRTVVFGTPSGILKSEEVGPLGQPIPNTARVIHSNPNNFGTVPAKSSSEAYRHGTKAYESATTVSSIEDSLVGKDPTTD